MDKGAACAVPAICFVLGLEWWAHVRSVHPIYDLVALMTSKASTRLLAGQILFEPLDVLVAVDDGGFADQRTEQWQG